MEQLMISLDENRKTPLYAQIYEYIRGEIKAGVIPAYTRLPSTRKLSESLQISRSTVQMAYDQLLAEGYLDAEPCRGYYAANVEAMEGIGASRKPARDAGIPGENEQEDRRGETLQGRETLEKEKTSGEPLLCDFSPAGVDLEHFPYKAWRRLGREVLTDETGRIFQKGMPQGEPGLRQAIASYLREARGVNCDPDQIVIGAGSEYLLMLVSLMIGRDSSIAMEDPTYLQAYRVLTSLGHKVIPISLDSMGMRVDLLEKTQARMAYCMPSHQYPTGTVMPISRRMELLKWAKEKDAYLIEDDYDSEFRYQGRPIPALQSADQAGRVIYLGTFSRAIAPAIRISFLVLPPKLLEKYRKVCGFYSCTVPRSDQEILARWMTDGNFERHLNRMRGIYKEKRNELLGLLEELGPGFTVQGDAAGVHILVRCHNGMSEEEMVQRAEKEQIRVYGVSRHSITGRQSLGASVILGFAGVNQKEMQAGVEGLIRAWKK